MDNVAIYRAAAERVAAIAESLTEQQAGQTVPATPEWSVHDLVAHVTGAASDFVTGNTANAPSRAWTNAHVVQRRGRPLGDIAAELRESALAVPADLITPDGAAVRWDMVVHEQDLREALGLERAPEETWRSVLPAALARLGRRPGVPGFDITTAEGTWRLGIPTTRLTFAGDDYELERVLFSRRTTQQISRLMAGVATLEAATVFGPRTV